MNKDKELKIWDNPPRGFLNLREGKHSPGNEEDRLNNDLSLPAYLYKRKSLLNSSPLPPIKGEN